MASNMYLQVWIDKEHYTTQRKLRWDTADHIDHRKIYPGRLLSLSIYHLRCYGLLRLTNLKRVEGQTGNLTNPLTHESLVVFNCADDFSVVVVNCNKLLNGTTTKQKMARLNLNISKINHLYENKSCSLEF